MLSAGCGFGSGETAGVVSLFGFFTVGAEKEGSSRMLPAPKFDFIGGGRKPAVGESAVSASGVGSFELSLLRVRSDSFSCRGEALRGLNDDTLIFSNGSTAAGLAMLRCFCGVELIVGFGGSMK